MKCKTCKFWDFFYEYDGTQFGHCRKYAPAVGQPETTANDWCGEYLEINRNDKKVEEI